MEKLKMVVMSEEAVVNFMAGCGKNNTELCGTKHCSFNNTTDTD